MSVGNYPGWPVYAADEVDAAAAVLRSGKVNYWTGGEGKAFEQDYADHCGLKYGIALGNGTLALELALYALDIGPGDEVVTPSRTFIASASAAVARGATPVVADIDRDSQNITAETIEAVLTPRTKAVVVVHLAGWPCDMDPIMELARRRGLKVIEDCAQAHGARYKGRPVGSIGDIGAFSFCQDKIITTGGEGGMLVTDDEAVWRKSWAYKDHGKSYAAVYEREHPPGFRWLHESFGTNWRLTEMQAVIGRLQLAKLDEWVGQRRRNAAVLRRALSAEPALRVPVPADGVEHAYYRFGAFVRPDRLRAGWSRERIMERLGELGVPVFVGSCAEIYREKAFIDAGLAPAEPLPVARELGETSLAFLVHPTLGESDMQRMADAVRSVMREATAPAANAA